MIDGERVGVYVRRRRLLVVRCLFYTEINTGWGRGKGEGKCNAKASLLRSRYNDTLRARSPGMKPDVEKKN